MKPRKLWEKSCGLPLNEALKQNSTLQKYIIKRGNRIDLGNPEALLLYNRLVFQDFMSLDFTVPPRFLIPTICSRWEFVSWVIRDAFPTNLPSRVLEIGTGASAVIALMLAKMGCYVEATEIDDIAFQSAFENIRRNNLESQISIMKIKEDILKKSFESLDRFDFIICNPPQYDEDYYIKHLSTRKRGFHGQKSELVGGKKGHEFIIRLLGEVETFSKPPCVYFQLLVPKLYNLIDSYLNEKRFSFSRNKMSIGNRYRYYYRVSF